MSGHPQQQYQQSQRHQQHQRYDAYTDHNDSRHLHQQHEQYGYNDSHIEHRQLGPSDSASQAGDVTEEMRDARDGVQAYGAYDGQAYYPYDGRPHYDNMARPETRDRQQYNSYPYPPRQSDGDDSDEASFMDGDTRIGSFQQHAKGGAYQPSWAPQNNARHSVNDEDDDNNGYNYGYPPTNPYTYDNDSKQDLYPSTPDDGGILGRLRARNAVKADSSSNSNYKRPHWLKRQIWDSSPTEQKIANHKKGIGVQDRPWACWVFAAIIVAVFCVELAQSAQRTGKVISTSPFNYMIGPSSELLINVGARFTACMRDVPEISNMSFACLNSSSSSSPTTTTAICTLSDICGFGGFGPSGIPKQTFRFFTAMWLHVGVVHLLLNGVVLVFSSGLVEKQMGTLKFVVLYLVTGTFGFILGGNFALVGLASMGASGAIFGTHAAVLVDLVAHWNLFERPLRMLIGLIVEILVGFGLGFVPGIDNFSHIGGFALGLLLSIVLLPGIHQTHVHKWTVYVLRCLSLVAACVTFGVLLNNFFRSDPNSACEWCRYLSCWPTDNNNHCKGTGLTTTTTTSTATGSLALFNTVILLRRTDLLKSAAYWTGLKYKV